MHYIKMSYKGLTFNVNPSRININMQKRVSRKAVPFGSAVTQEVSRQPIILSGSGAFVGEDAFEQAQELMRIFDDKGSAYLFAPDAMVLRAFFSKLDISYDAVGCRAEYTFEFTQDCSSRRKACIPGFTYALAGENLYDIANRCNVSTTGIYERNDYGDMFSVKEGDRVWLD